MEREYKCIDCGGVFVLDTQKRHYAPRCPECKRVWNNKKNAEWRDRERRKALESRTSKSDKK